MGSERFATLACGLESSFGFLSGFVCGIGSELRIGFESEIGFVFGIGPELRITFESGIDFKSKNEFKFGHIDFVSKLGFGFSIGFEFTIGFVSEILSFLSEMSFVFDVWFVCGFESKIEFTFGFAIESNNELECGMMSSFGCQIVCRSKLGFVASEVDFDTKIGFANRNSSGNSALVVSETAF